MPTKSKIKDDVDTMKNKIKSALLLTVLLMVACLLCACGGEETQFDKNDASGYNVSVKFDANGGEFTTNCYTIVDSFNISGMATNANGKVELALIDPSNALRGANDTYNVAKTGYFLAGWYATRNEVVDANGNVTYTYENKWDFEQGRLEVDPNAGHTASEPVITLYAAWIPMFEINFYDRASGELLKTETYNPTEDVTYYVPVWDTESGAIKMFKFPSKPGYTFDAVYYDAEGTQPATEQLVHTGNVDQATGTAVNPSMNVYVDWIQGEWYHIYTAQQLASNANRTGYYELHADLDFTDVNWPNSFMYGDFSGKIIGNGHTISNVTVVQNNNSATRFGLFGGLVAGAELRDVTFSNITATLQAGVRVSGAAYGLFAGNIAADAVLENVTLSGAKLQIDSDCFFSSSDYVIGLISGMGDISKLTYTDVVCEAVGDAPETVTIELDEQTMIVTVTIG